MSHIPERTQQKIRCMIFRVFRTMLHRMPRTEDDGLFDPDFITSEKYIIKHLFEIFQENPLFTPDYAEFAHLEHDLDHEKLMANPSWDLFDIHQTMIGDPQDILPTFITNAKNHPQFTAFITEHKWWEHYDYQTHRIPGTSFMDSSSEMIARTHGGLSIRDCVSMIHAYGGIRVCTIENRIFDSMLENKGISFGIIMNILLEIGYDTFWENPFAIYDKMIPDLYIKKPDDLHEILTEIFARCDLETIIRDPKKCDSTLTCLLAMVSLNEAWDVNMDQEFGERVWYLIKTLLEIELEKHAGSLRVSNECIIDYIKDLAQMWNPSWYVPKNLIQDYQDNIHDGWGGSALMSLHLVCAKVLKSSFNLLCDEPRSFINTYESRVLCKDMLRIRDVEPIGASSTNMYNRERFARNVTFRGEYGMIIGRFLFKKIIIPMRRARAMRLTKNVLSRVGEKSGRDVSNYSYCTKSIARFMTA